jgi:hypothetical protein
MEGQSGSKESRSMLELYMVVGTSDGFLTRNGGFGF